MARAAVLMGATGLLAATAASAGPAPGARPNPAARGRGFRLFSSTNLLLNVNRVQCGINNRGWACTDLGGSPSLPGGFWPKGLPNQYVYGGGLQLAAIIPGNRASFPWAGDTVGVMFEDATGLYPQAEALTPTFNSLDPNDITDANWPRAAYANDTALYHVSLIGKKAISQQDSWARYWDGNPQLSGGRTHTMGVLADTRSLAWNYPSGNNDIVYFLHRFINITSSRAADYANLADAGYSASDITDILAIANDFRAKAQSAYAVTIPDSGFAFTNMYASFTMDPDVTALANNNYSSAILPFSLAFAWRAAFQAPEFVYPPDVNGPPFANAPGFIGVKYLASPGNLGISIFGNTTNSAQFGDPRTVRQLWRYLSGNLSAQDGLCSFPGQQQLRHICYIGQSADDTRFFESSGPFTLQPGHSAVIVVAYVFAAPLGGAPAAAPSGFPAIPAFTLPIGGNVTPGYPLSGSRLASGLDTLHLIDRIAGLLSYGNPNADSIIDQNEFITQPRSLLNKALIAQAVFDNKFLLPFAPAQPDYFLLPGDGQVTVVWQKSATETDGDPYFAVASNAASPLYDPNFRKFDVEGYRIWRGRTQSTLSLVAQFDYAGTAIADANGNFTNDSYGNSCAPELGIVSTCPPFPHGVSLVGNVMQVPAGGRVELAPVPPATRGVVFVTQADTAVTGGGSGLRPLTDNGVPFSYIDNTVLNGAQYFYAVTAFDVNSLKSGPSSLESPLVTKTVTARSISANPRADAGALTAALVGSNGTALAGANPTISATTGIFSGPAAPTDGLQFVGSNIFAPQYLATNATVYVRIDSVVPHYYHLAQYFFTGVGPIPLGGVGSLQGGLGPDDATATQPTAPTTLPGDPASGLPFAGQVSAQFSQYPGVPASVFADWCPVVDGSFWNATGCTDDGGSRWFDGANETMADPTLGYLHGQLTGVNTIFEPYPYVFPSTNTAAGQLYRRFYGTLAQLTRAADIKIYWGATAGHVDSVIDVTHHVPVPWSPQNRASWGFVRDVTGTGDTVLGAPDGQLDWRDILWGACLPDMPNFSQTGCVGRNYDSVATLLPVETTGDAGFATDGQGFAMYINGEGFIFQTAALPVKPAVWTYRSYSGFVDHSTGTYTFTRHPANPAVPGLRLAITTSTAGSTDITAATTLDSVHTVPDPYYVTNSLESSSSTKILRFVNLPAQAIIRIYSASGILVAILNHNDPAGGGDAVWNLRSRNNQFVASGVYFYHVEAPDGSTKIGRFTVVNFAQ
jgi:hypothetical protein